MARLGIAVVGAGFMGALHARTIAESEGAHVTAIVEIDAARGRALAEQVGASWHADIEDALGRADAFVVALPDRLHEAATCRLLEAGKPVLLEKPMAHTLAAAQAIASAAQRSGARLLVAHILRFDPRYTEAAAAVRAGRIGTPVHATSGRWTLRAVGERMAGGSSPCFYLGIHDVDALQWISGAEVVRVFSRATSVGVSGGAPDAIVTTVEMTGGMVGQLYCGWTLPVTAPTGIWARTEVIGTEGLVDLDVRDHGLRILAEGRWSQPDGLHWPVVGDRVTGDLAEEIRHFVRALRDDAPFVMSVEEAMRNVAVNDAILRSVETGQPETVAPWR